MKKLIAAGCCFFFLQNFSKASINEPVEQNQTDGKTLIKAIAVIVNTEANKKLPAKRVFVASSEPPLY